MTTKRLKRCKQCRAPENLVSLAGVRISNLLAAGICIDCAHRAIHANDVFTPEKTSNGIRYEWRVGGAWNTETRCILHPEPQHNQRDIDDAIREIGKYCDVDRFITEPHLVPVTTFCAGCSHPHYDHSPFAEHPCSVCDCQQFTEAKE